MVYLSAALKNRRVNRINLIDIFANCGDMTPQHRRVSFKIKDSAVKWRERFLIQNNIQKDAIVIGFQIEAGHPVREWPIQYYHGLVRLILSQTNYKIILFGKRTFQGLERLKDKRIINTIGRLSLHQFAGLIERCDLFITPDTGPMHLAAALGNRNILGIFLGPAAGMFTGPYGEGFYILEPNISCAPCNYITDCENPVCKRFITPKYVAYISERIIKNLTIDKVIETANLYRTAFDEDGFFYLSPLKKTRKQETKFE